MPIYNLDAGVAKPLAGATKPKVTTAPRIWWFEGRSYSSEAAYAYAVSASQRRRAAQSAAVARAKELDRRREAAGAQARYRQAALAAARRRSELLRRQAIRQRELARAAELQRRAAAARRSQQRSLIMAGRKRRGPTPSSAMAAERQEYERRLAAQRRVAYDNLAVRSRAYLRLNPRNLPGPAAATPQAHKVNVMVRRAEVTGDWAPVLATLRAQSSRSAGRYIDPRLMKEVQAKYVAPIQKVRDEFSELVAELQAAEASGDEEALLKLVEDPDNVALYERFVELFGDGVKPGSFSETQKLLEQISEARQRSWAGPMAAGGRREMERLLDSAERETQVKTRRLPGRTPELIDSRLEDLEFTKYVLDPDTGKRKPVRLTGMDAWLAREQEREVDRVHTLQRQQVRWNQQFGRLLESEDMELDSVGNGRVVIRDRAVQRQATQIRQWMPGWHLNAEGIPTRIAAAEANPALREQLIREFMGEAERAFDRNMGQLRRNLFEAAEVQAREMTRGNRATRPQVVASALRSRSWEQARTAWLEALALRLGKPGWGELERFSSSGLGSVAQSALTIFSLAPAAVRSGIQQGLGSDYQPHLDVGFGVDMSSPASLLGSFTPFGIPGLQLTAGKTADPMADEAYRALGLAQQSGNLFDSIGAWSSAVRDYAGWGSGNLGWALTGATDPLMLVGPGRFMNAGRIAMARAGGLAGLRAGGLNAAGDLAGEFVRLSAPKAIGGAGRSAVRIEMAKLSLARKFGLPGGEALGLTDDEFRGLIERAAADRTDDLLASDVFRKLTESSGIEKNQLLSMVQQELPRILREYKIFPENPFEAARRIRLVRSAAVRARSEAEQAAQLARMQTERATAMQALADITGRPLEAPKLSPAKLTQHERLVSGYAQAAQEYLDVANRGLRAAEEIEKGTANARDLRGLHAQLKDAESEIRRFEDDYIVDRHGKKALAQRGVVGRYFDRLAQFRGQGDPTAPSFVDQSIQQVRYDERRIKSMIRQTLAQLKATPLGQPLNGQLKARLQKLEQARRGLVYERAMLDEGRTLMRPYARKHIARIERSVTPQRIAPIAANESQLAVEIGRDFMRSLHDVTARATVELSSAQEAAWAALRPQLDEAIDVAALVGVDHAKQMARALGRAPTRRELWTALRMADRDPAWSVEFGSALRSLDNQMVVAARQAGFSFSGMNAREAADYLWDVLRDDHARAGMSPGNFSSYKDLDRSVEQALVGWRRFRAEGQVRLRERRFSVPTDPVRAVFHDTDPFEVMVKMRELGARGSDLFAYDELRGVLRRPMLREAAAEGILERGTARAAREGIELEEALKLERADRAHDEAIRNVEEFATRPDLQGMPPETRLRAFEEKMMQDDLPVAPQVELSQFQIDALRSAFEEKLGFSFDDKHQISRYFRGELGEMPDGARAPRHGEFMVFDEADGIPVYVVPKSHPRLVNVPFGARPRELDDDIMRTLHDWDRQLVDAGMIDDVEDVTMRGAERPGSELGEAAAERRGAPPGRRQNAAAEARRSSRRNFQPPSQAQRAGIVRRGLRRSYGWHENAAPDGWQQNRAFVEMPIELAGDLGDSVESYRRWLWDQMQTRPEIRRQLMDLREKQIVHSSGAKAQVLADAIEWMKTPQAKEMFSAPDPHPAMLDAASTMGETEMTLRRDLAKYEEAHRVARELAGFENRPSAGAWERAKVGDLAIDEDGFVVQLTYSAGLKKQITRNRWMPVRDRQVSKEGLPSLVDLQGRPHTVDGRVTGTHTFKVRGSEWVKTTEGSDPTGIWQKRMLAFDQKIVETTRRLSEIQKGKSRPRSSVGMSVHGDGVYVAEGTSNITVAHEIFHQFWDNAFNATWRSDIEDAIDLLGPQLRSELWQRIRIGRAAYDPAEFAAELYALWRVGDSAGSDVLFSWADLRAAGGTFTDRQALERLGQVFGDHAPRVVDELAGQLNFPPLGHRSRLFAWMERQGHWSRRTGEAIREGERVWSVAEERRLFEGFMGYTPPWTDETVLKAVLNDPRLHEIMLREWGFFEDEYENLAAASGLTPEQQVDAMVWGKAGFARQRTTQELRDWSVQRYGNLVSIDDGESLIAMPWLMKADDEYLAWTRRFFDDALGQKTLLEAARDQLPPKVRRHLFDGDHLSHAGMEIDPHLVKAREVRKLRDAIERATRRRIERLKKVGDVEPGEWLAQENLRFAYDVTDQLLADPIWRGLLRGKPLAGAILHAWGQIWRLLVSWQPAFPIMNLIDSFGLKRLYLTVYQGGMRPLSLDAEGRRLVESLRQIGAESDSIFHLSGGSPWARVGDNYLSVSARGRSLGQGIAQGPVRISKFGEDRLRLDFARRVAGDTYRTAVKEGMSPENAEWLARHEAKRMVDSFFAITRGTGWETALNELVPFFSYNFKNKTLALQMMWNHPSVYAWGDRARQALEDANREQWAKDHPDLPFPEGPSASWLWWKVGDEYYKIDLSNFSDWTRAAASVLEGHTPIQWLTEFLRVPHPSQLGALAMFTGEETPWGKPGHIREMSLWADLFFWTRGEDYADPRQRRDLIQIMGQALFFQRFGKIGLMDIKQQTFFALRQLDREKAAAYLEANPDLQLYWDSLPPSSRAKGFDPMSTIHFRQLMTEEENERYNGDLAAWDELNDAMDARIAEFAAQPWSDEYKAAKREAFIARTQFMNEHPLLVRAWSTWMSPREFAELNDRFRVDDLADAWFNWKRPVKADFSNELAYQRALVAFNERREQFLEANPALEERLLQGRTAIERAWKEQELHWTDVLDFQARLKVRILEEELAGAPADRDYIDLLYRTRDLAGAELDADRYGVFEREFAGGRRGRFFGALPGFADLRYARATPAERKEMDRNNWYAQGIKDIVKRANSGKEFYDLLHQNPALLQEYWARNPDKKAEYQANQEYIRWIGSWARQLQAENFDGAQATWDSMPAWVKDRYFAKHPDSGMRDGMGGRGGSAFTDGQGNFFKSATSRDRFLAGQAYFASISRWVDLLKNKEFVKADAYFRSMPDWMKEKYYAKHPDQRAKSELDSSALRYGAEYFLATGDDKLKILAKYPQLRAWLDEHGGEEAAMRGLVQAMYRAIPSGEPWLRRTFREKFPEIFGKPAIGERRLKSVAAELAKHPEMTEFYERALRLQVALFLEQLKRGKAQPTPWTMERKKRVAKRTKRRTARLYSHWSLHSELRRQQ